MDNKIMEVDIKQEKTLNTINQQRKTSKQSLKEKRARSSISNTIYGHCMHCSNVNSIKNKSSLYVLQCNQQQTNQQRQSEKINKMRDKLNQTKDEIILLKARLNFLKFQTQRNQKRKTKNRFYIKTIQTVRERKTIKEKFRSEIQIKREKNINQLRLHALSLREKNSLQKNTAKLSIQQKKAADGQQQRRRRKQDEQLIKRSKSNELAQKQFQAEVVRKSELQIEKKLKQYNQIRMRFAQNNHRQKFMKTKAEKQKMDRLLQNLKKQQQKLLNQYKQSQINMLQTQKCLEQITLNPQAKKKC